MTLFPNIETMLKDVLGIAGKTKEEYLLSEVFNKYESLIEKLNSNLGLDISKEDYQNLWYFFVNIRNIYMHSGGYITQKALTTLKGGVNDKIKNFLKNLEQKGILYEILLI